MDQTNMRFDNMGIDIFEGRFSGTFDDQPSSIDDEHYILVRVRNKGASVSETKSGDLKRVNIYAISEAVRVDTDEAIRLSAAKNMQLALPDGFELEVAANGEAEEYILDI